MTVFPTQQPERCGVVVTNEEEIVIEFQEKVPKPNSNIANAATYIFDPEVFTFLQNNPAITNISTGLIPHYIGNIKIFRHAGFLIDIGTPESLIEAQFIDNNLNLNAKNKFSDRLTRMKFDKICEEVKCLASC
tara:strand:- start:125 stop:523 length:399 start_codon:yes stop_codon:yes gene_type:complete